MLKVTYRLKLGQDEFELNLDVKDEKEFFEQLSFYSNLPKTAPGGADDLKLVFRTTKKGHKYYSLISEKEQMEFKLGQNLDTNGGGLFCKGWEKSYQSDEDSQDQDQSQQRNAAPLIGAQTQTQKYTTPIVTPTVQQVTQATSAPAPVPTPMTIAPAQAQNQNVTAVANNVLSRFGINK